MFKTKDNWGIMVGLVDEEGFGFQAHPIIQWINRQPAFWDSDAEALVTLSEYREAYPERVVWVIEPELEPLWKYPDDIEENQRRVDILQAKTEKKIKKNKKKILKELSA